MVETDESWVASGVMDGRPFIVISDIERYKAQDTGGYIYELPSDAFAVDPEKGLREDEYTSSEAVVPTNREYHPSALKAMVDEGVAVYVLDTDQWQQYQTADDGGEALLQSLTPLQR